MSEPTVYTAASHAVVLKYFPNFRKRTPLKFYRENWFSKAGERKGWAKGRSFNEQGSTWYMAQPAAKIPIQNRQYTMSKNSSYTIISSLQISPKAGKVKPALPAIAILNPAGIPNLMPGPWAHTFSSTTQDLQKLGTNVILHYSILTLN